MLNKHFTADCKTEASSVCFPTPSHDPYSYEECEVVNKASITCKYERTMLHGFCLLGHRITLPVGLGPRRRLEQNIFPDVGMSRRYSGG